MNKKDIIMQDLYKKLDAVKEKGYNVIFMALQGSQNYSLDRDDETYKSDIDAKCFVLPTFSDIFDNKMLSKTLEMDDGSLVDIKDVRLMLDLFSKANPSYLELLFTEYMICDNEYMEKIVEMRDEIAEMNKDRLLSSILGMAKEKQHALAHRYHKKIEIIDKYGYDPKQLSHCKRMEVMMYDIFERNIKFGDAVHIPDINSLNIIADYKYNVMSLSTAVDICNDIVKGMEEFKNNYRNNHKKEFNEKTFEQLKTHIKYMVYKNILKSA